MSYSSKLMTLRALVSRLRSVVSELESPDLTIMDYFMMQDLLDKVALLKDVIDGKKIVLDLTEDEEGSYIGYELLVVDKSDPEVALSKQDVDALAPGLETLCKESIPQEAVKPQALDSAVWLGYSCKWPIAKGEVTPYTEGRHASCSKTASDRSSSGHDSEESLP